MNPITREESLLDGQDLTPITRKEQFIKRIYDKTQEIPEPITREEWFLKKAGEGTSPVTIEQLNATENGTYSEQGKAYSPVIVEVPAPTLITKTITENGTYNASEDNADGYSQVTVAVEGFKKKSIANTPTAIASFNDGTANPMPSLEISIEPVQSGSGDPSPSNVRPISGWSGANVSRMGKNLLPNTFSSYSTNNNYAFMNGIVPNGETAIFTLTDKDTSVDISGCYIGFQKGLSEQVNNPSAFRWAINNGVVQTNRSNDGNNAVCDGVIIYPKDQTTFDKLFARYDIMVELGSTETSYEPYNGSTLSIPFHDDSDNPITVYGGRLNVTAGELTVTMASVDLGTLTWGKGGTYNNIFYATPVNAKKPGSDTQLIKTFICDRYESTYYNAINIDDSTTRGIAIRSADTPPTIRVKDPLYQSGSPEAFKNAMGGAQFVYELATSVTYQLTPAQVTTLLGQNNIFAGCGQILQGEYFVTL